MASSRFSAVVFDLDGTVVDSFASMIATVNRSLIEHGFPPAPDHFIRRQLRQGSILDEVYARLDGISAADVPNLTATYRHYYLTDVVHRTPAMPGAAACLARLAEAGMALAVATSKRRDAALLVLEATGLAKWFPLIVAFNDVARHKPATDSLDLISERLGIPPQRMLMVGDAVVDVQMGQAAGAGTCAILSEPDNPALAAAPDYVITHLDELPPIVLEG